MRPVIFIHIQKTGGSSIREALGHPKGAPHKHRTANEIRHLYDDAAWQDAFKFAFVRNPWDRLVSWWSYFEGRRGRPVNRFGAYILQNASTFHEFLRCDQTIEDVGGTKCIYRNQVDYLRDDLNFIGRFEHLADDWELIRRQIGPLPDLARVNTSNRQASYRSYYTDETAAMVAAKYAADIKTFDYGF